MMMMKNWAINYILMIPSFLIIIIFIPLLLIPFGVTSLNLVNVKGGVTDFFCAIMQLLVHIYNSDFSVTSVLQNSQNLWTLQLWSSFAVTLNFRDFVFFFFLVAYRRCSLSP